MSLLYAWGANSSGQLGLGLNSEQEIEPILVPYPNNAAEIYDVQPGSNFCLILQKNGFVYGSGQLTKTVNFSIFTQINEWFANETIQKIAAGWDFCFFLTNSGILYGLGSNKYYQLCGKQPKKFLNEPIRVDMNRIFENSMSIVIEKIVCGLRDTAIIYRDCKTDRKFVKLFGKNFNETVRFESNPKIVSIGESHSLILLDDGKVYGKGSNKFGQLQNDNQSKSFNYWFQLPIEYPIVDLKCGWYHSVLKVATSCHLLTFGRNTYGQLGRSSSETKIVPNLKSKLFAVGSQHNLCLDAETNQLYCWGWNEHGSCGNGSIEDCFDPVLVRIQSNFTTRNLFAAYGQSFTVFEKTDVQV